MTTIKRRTAIQAALAGAGYFLATGTARADSPNGKLCTGHIGVGGKGRSDLAKTANHANVQVVGLCDVDTTYGDKARALHKSAAFFRDYREMLDRLGDKVDAVTVSTPDHTHYPATLAAMERGKHAYTQKPLTHTVAEARHLAELAAERNLVTQMGIQNHASTAYRAATRYIQTGEIGKVSKVYAWSFKNWGDDGAAYRGEDPIPKTLDWNLWLGAAPKRPYVKKKYHPKQWRRILDFGCGTLGDMGVHIVDTPFRALKLGAANSARARCRTPNGFAHPEKLVVEFGFRPTKYTTDNFAFTWFDGDYAPPQDVADLKLPEGDELPKQGAMFIGEKGRMVLPHCAAATFFPNSNAAKTVGRSQQLDLKSVDHYHQFIDAIAGDDKTSASFAYSLPIMETLHLGVIAAHFPGKKLNWDAKSMRVVNLEAANELVRKEYRKF